MATFKLLLGLGVTIVLLGVAGASLRFLYRVGASAQPVEPGRVGSTGDIARAEVVEVAAQKKLVRWTTPGLAHFALAAPHEVLGSVPGPHPHRNASHPGAEDDSVQVLDIAEVLLRSIRLDLDDASKSGATTATMFEQ